MIAWPLELMLSFLISLNCDGKDFGIYELSKNQNSVEEVIPKVHDVNNHRIQGIMSIYVSSDIYGVDT